MARYRYVEPVPSTSTVSQNYTGRPIIGPVIDTTNLPRVLIGWNHQDDTPEGLMKGQMYCSVSRWGTPKLQIFDTSGNRSKEPGVVVFCGMANYTMVRMFHPYWAEAGPNGTLPRDMAWRPDHRDKARLRQLYHEFLRDHYGLDGNGEHVYQIPPENVAGNDGTATTATNADDQSLFVGQHEKATAGSSSAGTANRKPGRPANQNRVNKRPLKKRPAKPKTRDTGFAILFPDTHKLTEQNSHRQVALNDGESIKSESRATSVTTQSNNGILLSTSILQECPISLDASPARNLFNAIDIDELQGLVEEQNAAFPASQSSSKPSQVINLSGDYNNDVQAEQLEFDRILQDCGAGAQSNGSGSPQLPGSPQLSNDGLRDSIETDETQEQDAQVLQRGNSDTLIAMNDDDLQII